MPSIRESILVALHARLLALPATVLPERVPAEGLLVLRDGEPEEAGAAVIGGLVTGFAASPWMRVALWRIGR